MKILRKKMATSSKAQKGSVLVEFTLVLPLLFILLIGTLELGRSLNEASWLVQASYQSAKLGSESPSTVGIPAMKFRAERMESLQNKFLHSIEIEPAYNEAEGLVSTKITGTLNSLVPYFPIRISMASVGPHLLRTWGTAGDLGQFQNPAGDSVQCTGTCITDVTADIDYSFGRLPVDQIDPDLIGDLGGG